MRKLFTLALILAFAVVSEAQPAYYVHNATAGGSVNIFPFNVNPATGKKVQWLITPAGSAGGFSQPSAAPAGQNITNLWFWANTAANATYTNLTIRMASVSPSLFFSVGSWYTGPMTTVRSQNTTLVSSGPNTWVNIPLTTPFFYDPTMNLIVEVYQCGYTGTGFTLRQLVYGSAPQYRRLFSDASSVCGAVVFPTLADNSVAGIGISVVPAANNCAQNFDAVTAPALPAGWVATENIDAGGFSDLWATTNSLSSSAPNSVTTNDPGDVSDEWLDSRVFPITSPTSQLSFRNRYDLETNFDGMVLEISIGGGPFTDIITAGGSFVTGGYNSTISGSFGSPIAGRSAWSGNSGGFITTTVNLPAAANGQNVVVRWRRATDVSVSATGAWIDDVTVSGSDCGIGSCVVTCPANIIVNAPLGQCGAVVNYPAPTTNGGCGPVTSNPASGSTFPVGTTTVNVTTFAGPPCSFTVTVVDNQPPTITCPANITVSNTTGQCSAVVATPAPSNADNCAVTVRTWALSGATTGSSPATGINTVPATQVFNVGVTTVTYTARDNAGNSATCSFTVTVNDTQPPVITCPANITVNNAPGLCSATVNYPLPTATDNCALQTLTQSNNNSIITALSGVACSAPPNSFWRAYTLGGSGSITINSVRFGVEQSNAAQTVNVRLYTSAGPFPASPRTQIASTTVAVTTAPLVFYTVNFPSPPSVPAGTIVAVEVNAQTAVMYPGANGLGESAPSYISASACGVTNPVTFASVGFPNTHLVLDLGVSQPVPVTLVSGPPVGGSFPVGTTPVTYRATDPSGNTATCTFNVTVVDAEAPTITCPANITRPTDIGTCVAAGVVVPNPTNADNCGIVTRTWVMTGATTGSSPASGINSVGTQTFNLGVTTITYTVRDAAGNSTSCSFTVTITDAEIPVISVQPQSRTACANDNVTFSVTAAPAGGTFTLTYQWQRFDGTAWQNIAGATANSYTLSNVDIPLNHTSFRVLIQGRCTQVISNVALLNVNPKPKVFITSSTTSFVIRPGENISLIASAIPAGGTVQWSFMPPGGSSTPINNATSMTLANVSVNNLGVGTYTATYTDLNGCVQSASVSVTGEALTKLFIYPSPTSGAFQVRFYNTAGQQVQVNVYDSKGSKVYSKNETLGAQQYSQIKVNLVNAEAGIYLVEVKDAGGNKIGAGHVVVSR